MSNRPTFTLPQWKGRWSAPACGVLVAGILALALPGQAQTPTWELAQALGRPLTTGNSSIRAMAADTAGNLFVTGSFSGSVQLGSLVLSNSFADGTTDLFVAKWDATAQDFTWATSGGGGGNDVGLGVAVSGARVFVTGSFEGGTNCQIAGQALTSVGGTDFFVAKYTDTSTGHTPATSSVATGWVATAGSPVADGGKAIAVSGDNVYVTGTFSRTITVAGRTLANAAGTDFFVAKYIDTSTGPTPAASSFANGWATRSGGNGAEVATGIAVQGTGVYVTGYFDSNLNANIAGQPLTGSGNTDMFVAKYLDTSTGTTPATSSVANGWVASGGGSGGDVGMGVAVRGTGVYVVGSVSSGTRATVAGQVLTGQGSADMFVAKFIDTSTGNTPATSRYANGWAVSGGGSGVDGGTGIAVVGRTVYVAGSYQASATAAASVAGQALPASPSGGIATFLAKFVDTSTGLTPATSSVANGWALAGGSTTSGQVQGLALHRERVAVTGQTTLPTTFGTLALGPGRSGQAGFVARLTDAGQALATTPAAAVGFELFPNPAHDQFTLRLPPVAGAARATATLVNALGQVMSTRTLALTAGGAQTTYSTAGLAAGVYALCLQAGTATATLRVVVE